MGPIVLKYYYYSRYCLFLGCPKLNTGLFSFLGAVFIWTKWVHSQRGRTRYPSSPWRYPDLRPRQDCEILSGILYVHHLCVLLHMYWIPPTFVCTGYCYCIMVWWGHSLIILLLYRCSLLRGFLRVGVLSGEVSLRFILCLFCFAIQYIYTYMSWSGLCIKFI